jgi:hypothetical protein
MYILPVITGYDPSEKVVGLYKFPVYLLLVYAPEKLYSPLVMYCPL